MKINGLVDRFFMFVFLAIFMMLSFGRFYLNNSFFLVLIFLFCLYLVVKSLKVRVIKNSYFFFILVLYCIISSVWSVNYHYTLFLSLHLCVVLLIGLIFVNQYNRDEIINMLLIYSFILTLLNVISIIFLKDISIDSDGRYQEVYRGLFSQKNGLGKYMSLSIFIASWSIFYNKGLKYKIISGTTIFLATICLYLSKSSTSMGFTVLIIFLITMFKMVKSKKIVIYSCLSILAISIFVLINPPTWFSYFLQYTFDRDLTFTGRTYIWEIAKNHINSSPYIGYGYQGFWSNDHYNVYVWRLISFNPTHSHNGFIDLVLALGCIGTILYLFIVIKFLKKCFRAKMDIKYLAFSFGLFMCIWLNNLLETDLIYPYSMFFLFQFFAFHIVTEE